MLEESRWKDKELPRGHVLNMSSLNLAVLSLANVDCLGELHWVAVRLGASMGQPEFGILRLAPRSCKHWMSHGAELGLWTYSVTSSHSISHLWVTSRVYSPFGLMIFMSKLPGYCM